MEGRKELLLVAFKMSFAVVLILVSLPLLDAEKEMTLDDAFLVNYKNSIGGAAESFQLDYIQQKFLEYDPNTITSVIVTEEIYEYLIATEHWILMEFTRLMAAVPVQFIYEDLNEHCSEHEIQIEGVTVKFRDTSCVQIRLREMVTSKFKMAVEAGLQQMSNACIRKEVPFCSVANRSCTLAYEERMRQMLISYIEDWNNVKLPDEETPLDVIKDLLIRDLFLLFESYSSVGAVPNVSFFNISNRNIQPFGIENVLRPWTVNSIREIAVKNENNTVSEDESTWGIIKANTGKFDRPCSYFRDKYSLNSDQFIDFLISCYNNKVHQFNVELMGCGYSDPKTPTLKWLAVPPVYFHSECLCLAFKGRECRVKAAQGDDPYFYCLSVLLRDFQRRVSYRPAITYLDYAFQTRVPLCEFGKLLHGAFKSYCNDTAADVRVDVLQAVQCYFEGFVNKPFNCTEKFLVDNLNYTSLCHVRRFMLLVICDDETNEEVLVSFYGAGDSTLVLVLTYVDVTVRVVTLVTYLVCSDLRNLPGKLLIAYQVTALVRLLVVRADLENLQMAVRLDVAMDLSSTLWLTSYLHFLTVSIETLRPPDTLRPDEVRMVLLRYSLLGWALPTALSAAFFFMDEAIDSRVQFGQLSFVLCNYLALFANVYMFFKNCHFYYDVKSSARILQKGGKSRSVFADLFNFAMKTAVLSGAGITLRLIFTQFQGLQDLLGYYHALGTLQGLLLFFLYGCNREARVFWIGVFRSTLSHCSHHNTSPP